MSEDGGDRQRQSKPMSYKDRRKLQNPERKRHGARNHDRSKVFVRWLAEAFPNQLAINANEKTNGDLRSLSSSIVDVAGGKGEVAARLCVCLQCHVTLVDPRACDVERVFRCTVLRQLPKKYQQRLEERTQNNPDFVTELFRGRFRQFATLFDEETLESSHELNEAIRQCSLIIGLHADGATEAIVDAALRYRKPFCVVPCCVFPSLFPQRRIRIGNDDGATGAGEWIPVRTYEQFCTYLTNKNPRFRQTALPFEGRNICIWWDGT